MASRIHSSLSRLVISFCRDSKNRAETIPSLRRGIASAVLMAALSISSVCMGEAMQSHDACTDSESWDFGEESSRDLPKELTQQFERLLANKIRPIQGFADAYKLKGRYPEDSRASVFVQYWLGRALHKAQAFEKAMGAFSAIIAKGATAQILPVQIAALQCAVGLHHKHPIFSLSAEARAALPLFAHSEIVPAASKSLVWEAGLQIFLDEIKDKQSETETGRTLENLKGGGYFEDFAEAVWAVRQGKVSEAIQPLSRLVDGEDIPASLRSRRNELRLLLAHAYYENEKYAEAIRVLEGVDKRSNELVPALISLAGRI